ncbi:MAG: hypothetical protein IH969_04095, partial [Candidatus Krumholzibacteriota bacterium]|nr:hypothetical protein [Candidatus Krumholzibacteriota bacterium]
MIETEQLGLFDSFEAPHDAILTPDEIFRRLDSDLVLRLSEDRRVERKPASFQGEPLGQYISMWANTAPSGGIVILLGLLLGLAGAGLIDYYTVIPVLLGDNIGTTITAQLATIAATRTARQTAHAHTLFNVMGTSLLLASFFFMSTDATGVSRPAYHEFINCITPGNAWERQNLERHIANAHSIFNVLNVAVQLPFIAL